ncbi:pyrrolo-quinoline quinone synthesis protein PqqD [Neoasaia chiangmaiensis NBRC 101099]|uniref:Pyrroloquinoline quinone biosynthesis protein PqqD n=1 Tax=Neoasaia chiangmaiensis TaxID=320497 RepID=A0A1U9KQB9_9PROT|nr:pyrroloquinoline quinone biosynthesis peptide chaperone PqqD [Neoasaia chiangmaiensis]AQS88034.1 pyrroloquinoline quinone biosynthesis protein PqqD [Neoasaia chiangmaiensis]GBR38810.1 pyrrolo-quinoline quinone synthesis protein PqqD [Neoasaia chiangmaiensis NBRC 101099]GEN15707.1 hypothetical protein NCH01_21380 [Neoasaia chiangmaiensis]
MTLDANATPRFTRGHRLRHDTTRDVWLIQAPEKAFVADPIAAAVLQRVDGERSIATIVDDLARVYQAPRETIERDVLTLLADLTDKRVLIA